MSTRMIEECFEREALAGELMETRVLIVDSDTGDLVRLELMYTQPGRIIPVSNIRSVTLIDYAVF